MTSLYQVEAIDGVMYCWGSCWDELWRLDVATGAWEVAVWDDLENDADAMAWHPTDGKAPPASIPWVACDTPPGIRHEHRQGPSHCNCTEECRC
jgi:hypothetical protein